MKTLATLLAIAAVVWTTDDGKDHIRQFDSALKATNFYETLLRQDNIRSHGYCYSDWTSQDSESSKFLGFDQKPEKNKKDEVIYDGGGPGN